MASRTGPAISDHAPLVAHLPRAAELLAIPEPELEAAVQAAQLPAWGTHSSGQPVYSWRPLVAAAVAAGLPVPARWTQARRPRRAIVTSSVAGRPS